jgi:multiple sugar transport system substrate-binding protein
MKNILRISLILMALLLACGHDDGAPPPVPLLATGVTGQEQTTIRFAIYDWEAPAYKDLIATFEEENPDLRVRVVSIEETLGLGPNHSEWPTDAERRLLAAADVAKLTVSRQTVAQGLVYDLTPLIEADAAFQPEDYYPGMVEAHQWAGGTWALPTVVSFQVILYDKDAFDRAGLGYPQPGWSWDEFLVAARALTVREGDKVTRWGFVQPWPVHLPFVAGRAGPLVDQSTDPPTPRFDQPEVIEAVQWYADLYLEHEVMPYFPPAALTPAQALIDDGQAAMWVDVAEAWEWRKVGSNLGVAPYPVDGADSYTTPAQTRGLCLSAGTRQPEAAWRWLSFLSRQPLSGLGPTVASLPPRRSVARSSGFWEGPDEELAAALRFALDHACVNPNLPAGGAPGFWAFQQAMSDILQEKTGVEAALAEAQMQAQREVRSAVAQQARGIPTPDFVVEAGAGLEPLGKTTITFALALGSPDLSLYRELADLFHEAQPDVVVEVTTPDFHGGPLGLRRMAEVADCFQWVPGLADPENRSAILSLEPLLESDPSLTADDFYPHILVQFTYQGQLWGLPGAVAPYFVEYNRDLFDAAGLEYPALDWTWDDFVATAVALTRGEGEAKQYGFVSDYYEPNDLLIMVELLGARLVDLSAEPPEFCLDHPATVEAMRHYTSLTTEYGVKPVLATSAAEAMNLVGPYQERKALIATGRAAMWTTSAVAMPAWDERSELDVGVAPLPAGPQGGRGGNVPASGYFISAGAQDPEACWQWIRFLTDQPSAAQGLPARRSVAESDEYRRLVGVERVAVYLASAVEEPSSYQLVFREGWLGGGAFWLARAYSQVLAGEASVEEALAAAQALADDYRACVITSGNHDEQAWQRCVLETDPTIPPSMFGLEEGR